MATDIPLSRDAVGLALACIEKDSDRARALLVPYRAANGVSPVIVVALAELLRLAVEDLIEHGIVDADTPEKALEELAIKLAGV